MIALRTCALAILTLSGCGRVGYDGVGLASPGLDATAVDGSVVRTDAGMDGMTVDAGPTDAATNVDAAPGDGSGAPPADAGAPRCTPQSGYTYCAGGYTWAEARDYCASLGLALATLDNRADNIGTVNGAVLFGSTPFWAGLNDLATEGDFRWLDGSSPTYTDWAPGAPDDPTGLDDCVLVPVPIADYTWDDVSCDERHGFVCEAP